VIVVSDTSALSALIQINRTDLLQRLYQRIAIPFAVRDELLKFHRSIPLGIDVLNCDDRTAVERLQNRLGLGESQAIVLAKQIKADVLLVDEQRGRRIARAEGLQIIGVVGVLAAARENGFIPALSAAIDELIATGFYVSPEIRLAILKKVGEA
jgi:predicted nucleic acid-binding protein